MFPFNPLDTFSQSIRGNGHSPWKPASELFTPGQILRFPRQDSTYKSYAPFDKLPIQSTNESMDSTGSRGYSMDRLDSVLFSFSLRLHEQHSVGQYLTKVNFAVGITCHLESNCRLHFLGVQSPLLVAGLFSPVAKSVLLIYFVNAKPSGCMHTRFIFQRQNEPPYRNWCFVLVAQNRPSVRFEHFPLRLRLDFLLEVSCLESS